MTENIYKRSGVSRLVTTSFETIRADRFRHAQLVQSLRVKLYPTTVLVGSDNRVLDVIEGYVEAEEFLHRLKSGLASTPGVTSAASQPPAPQRQASGTPEPDALISTGS